MNKHDTYAGYPEIWRKIKNITKPVIQWVDYVPKENTLDQAHIDFMIAQKQLFAFESHKQYDQFAISHRSTYIHL